MKDTQGNLVTPGINLEFRTEYYLNREREWGNAGLSRKRKYLLGKIKSG